MSALFKVFKPTVVSALCSDCEAVFCWKIQAILEQSILGKAASMPMKMMADCAGRAGKLMRFITAFNKFLILTALLFATGTLQSADVSPSEYKLKAAFIYHFSQFVDWPAKTFSEANAPFIIGVLGENPFGHDLEQTVQGKAIGGHALTVKEFHSVAEAINHCQILFVSSSQQKRLPEIIAGLDSAGILTVGESDDFESSGGMIRFVFEGAKIRFRVNEAATSGAGLRVSAKLLSLASHTAK